MRKVNQEEFKKIITSGKYLVDFYADWCGPCKMIAPILTDIEKELNLNGVEILKVNVDENPELAEEMRIQFIPYVVTFSDGKIADSFSGYKSEEELKQFVKNSLGI
ncbi:MAG: thioredoxin [Christensenellales bacterium]